MKKGQNVTETPESVTQGVQAVTVKRDTSSRARTPLRGVSRLSRVTDKRDVTVVKRDSDIRPEGSRHGHETGRKAGKEKTSWMHIAAMNLIDDHASGKVVAPEKLTLARRLLGMPEVAQ